MKLATNRYHVAIKGTKKITNYYGYKTRTEAEEIATRLVELGIRAFWNFAHVDLNFPEADVVVENVHLSESLMQLSYNIVKNSNKE
jgi:NADH/NAD ratio-sensing transcriptional regulator Rex